MFPENTVTCEESIIINPEILSENAKDPRLLLFLFHWEDLKHRCFSLFSYQSVAKLNVALGLER
jgi:hypothetical protein